MNDLCGGAHPTFLKGTDPDKKISILWQGGKSDPSGVRRAIVDGLISSTMTADGLYLEVCRGTDTVRPFAVRPHLAKHAALHLHGNPDQLRLHGRHHSFQAAGTVTIVS